MSVFVVLVVCDLVVIESIREITRYTAQIWRDGYHKPFPAVKKKFPFLLRCV